MGITTRDSRKTQPLFDKSVVEIQKILDQGTLERSDKTYMDLVMKAFTGHIKVRNTEIKENMLKFAVSEKLHANIEGMKETLQQQLPEYVSGGKELKAE